MPFDNPVTRPAEVEAPHQEEIAILRGMRARLATPERWCKGDYERDGASCLMGAGRMVALGTLNSWRESMSLNNALYRLSTLCGGRRVDAFNDALTTTHQDILNLIDRAIASFS